jgi:hypothetical protein
MALRSSIICFLLMIAPMFAAFAVAPASLIGRSIPPLVRHVRALAPAEIDDLARRALSSGGTREVGKILGQRNLPDPVLEDAFIRIAVRQSRISAGDADRMFGRLSGVPGFRSTLSKVIGASDAKSTGHLNELRIASTASEYGFKVEGIGVRFVDPAKSAPTDIDVLLSRSGRRIAIEAKDYRPTTPIPMDSFRADMETLNAYGESLGASRVLRVFTITNKPEDPAVLELLLAETRRRGVELIVGSPVDQVIQIRQLIP